MKKIYLFVVAVLLTQLCFGQFYVSRPINNSVYQRSSSNDFTVTVVGQLYTGPSPSPSIEWRVLKLDPHNSAYQSTVSDWQSQPTDFGGLFNFPLLLSGGWYQAEFRANGGAQTASVRFGIGDVYVIAGQSNAQGLSASEVSPYYGAQPYDGVVADLHVENAGCLTNLPPYPSMAKLTPGAPIAPQGKVNWCYTVLGNQLVDLTGVPVAFFNAAQQSTGVRNWEESLSNTQYTYSTYNSATPICNQIGQPYKGLQTTLHHYASLFGMRGLLWHQGENDGHDERFSLTNRDQYRSRLRNVITRSRNDFGKGDFSWWVCNVSQNDFGVPGGPFTSVEILNAQSDVQGDANNKPGPATDGLGPRIAEHFTDTGLLALGNAWYTSLSSTVSAAQPIAANSPLPVSMGYSGGSYILTAGGGYSDYKWVDASAGYVDPNYGFPGSSLSLSDGGTYICYARNAQGNYIISQSIRVPRGSGRLAAERVQEETDPFQFKVFPNPVDDQVNISFQLANPADIQLQLIDSKGQIVNTLVTNRYQTGTFQQTVDISRLPTGIYHYRLRVNNLFLMRKILKKEK